MKETVLKRMYKQMVLIRSVEETLESLFSQGKLFGTTHAYIGQEAIAVGVITALSHDDIITSNHRGHGHYLAYTDDVEGLISELMGKETGVCGGRGGSQHLHKDNFYSNGVTGGMIPVATGMAFAEKCKGSSSVVICFLGDGAVGEGVFYESLNLASLWQVPILYVVENNQYAMSTPVSFGIQGKIADRGHSVGLAVHEFDTHDVEEVYQYTKSLVDQLRRESRPHLLVFNTYRLCGHSKSDDRCYRSRDEEREWEGCDPISILESRLEREWVKSVRIEVRKRIDKVLEQAEKAKMGSFLNV